MMRPHLFLLALLALILLPRCGSVTTKPTYLLGNPGLRLFQAGDSLNFAAIGSRITNAAQDITGSITLRWSASSETVYPGGNIPIAEQPLMQRMTISLNGQASEHIDYHFHQNKQGTLYLYALQTGSELLWVMPRNSETPGIEWFSSPLPGEVSRNISFDIYLCKSNACSRVGEGEQELIYEGIERQETPYAVFEAYRYNYRFHTISSDPERFDNTLLAQLSGTRWYYPALGIIKFTFDRDNANESLKLIASLNSTNIPLP